MSHAAQLHVTKTSAQHFLTLTLYLYKMKDALLIIDLQEDFLPPNGALAVKDGRGVIHTINNLVEDSSRWELIIASKDWHPSDHCSFASNHPDLKPFEEAPFENPENARDKKNLTVWPDHCVQNSFGSQFPEEFSGEGKIHHVIKKGFLRDREYYSAFEDIFSIDNTELKKLLIDKEIENVYIVGLAMDFCVYHTAIDSARLGWRTFVLKDATRPVDLNNEGKIIQELKEHGVEVIF